ncbi:MAG: cytochrome c [Deltaproteobacteria bacterium]|nr:MAG: cytochrome c [Deltaproteobacteria bacterium]
MLSKSQAKLFFLLATAGFSGVFLYLTVDTMRQVPERSHEDLLTDQVIAGKMLWEENNCMGCHTILGEGAYYAPELTKVYDRRGPVWMRTFLKDPQAMYPGQRKMVQYDFTDEEIEALIAFFDWVGKIDTNGFPREPDLKVAGVVPTSTSASTGGPPAPDTFTQVCQSCHSLAGSGGNVGPALDGVGNRYSAADLRAWLADPQSVKPGTAMPNLNLGDDQLDALTAFLMAQK